ncbi:MAG: DNA repair protein RadA [candidate division Zixibacteria bacterium]|nr:DNA repair protein RadA [candidate division Zixibacteria bacterium]
MASKTKKTIYICEKCGYESPKWLGKCPQCDEWDTFSEQLAPSKFRSSKTSLRLKSAAIPLPDIRSESFIRVDTGFVEFNRVLGGGLAPGSINLLGGEPGIGKSTILLQIAGKISDSGYSTVYISGEESEIQIKNRAERLGIDGTEIIISTETNIHEIIGIIKSTKPALTIIDSVQTVYDPDLGSFPGTISQIRESTALCTDYAKKSGTSFVLSGHITKDGSIAGPKLLEHMVDTVLYFEGDKDFLYRIIRGVKNRFGPAGEIGVFEMMNTGLVEIADPSGIFLSDTQNSSGSIVTPMMEGSRPFLVEVQALAVPTGYSVSQKVSVGYDGRKLSLIAAICEKKGNLKLGGMDLFVKILGGVRAEEAAVDLPVALAIFSSTNDISLPPQTVVFGELGLSGEIRGVSNSDRRISEAVRMGFKNIILPSSNKPNNIMQKDIDIIGVRHLRQAFEFLKSP